MFGMHEWEIRINVGFIKDLCPTAVGFFLWDWGLGHLWLHVLSQEAAISAGSRIACTHSHQDDRCITDTGLLMVGFRCHPIGWGTLQNMLNLYCHQSWVMNGDFHKCNYEVVNWASHLNCRRIEPLSGRQVSYFFLLFGVCPTFSYF